MHLSSALVLLCIVALAGASSPKRVNSAPSLLPKALQGIKLARSASMGSVPSPLSGDDAPVSAASLPRPVVSDTSSDTSAPRRKLKRQNAFNHRLPKAQPQQEGEGEVPPTPQQQEEGAPTAAETAAEARAARLQEERSGFQTVVRLYHEFAATEQVYRKTLKRGCEIVRDKGFQDFVAKRHKEKKQEEEKKRKSSKSSKSVQKLDDASATSDASAPLASADAIHVVTTMLNIECVLHEKSKAFQHHLDGVAAFSVEPDANGQVADEWALKSSAIAVGAHLVNMLTASIETFKKVITYSMPVQYKLATPEYKPLADEIDRMNLKAGVDVRTNNLNSLAVVGTQRAMRYKMVYEALLANFNPGGADGLPGMKAGRLAHTLTPDMWQQLKASYDEVTRLVASVNSDVPKPGPGKPTTTSSSSADNAASRSSGGGALASAKKQEKDAEGDTTPNSE